MLLDRRMSELRAVLVLLCFRRNKYSSLTYHLVASIKNVLTVGYKL